jgi:hypothetical protein
MSRVEKFGRGRIAPPSNTMIEETAASEIVDDWAEDGLPARRHIHPSNKQQMTKWFYRLLIVLFFSLLIGLLMWGRQNAKF